MMDCGALNRKKSFFFKLHEKNLGDLRMNPLLCVKRQQPNLLSKMRSKSLKKTQTHSTKIVAAVDVFIVPPPF